MSFCRPVPGDYRLDKAEKPVVKRLVGSIRFRPLSPPFSRRLEGFLALTVSEQSERYETVLEEGNGHWCALTVFRYIYSDLSAKAAHYKRIG